MKIFPIALCLMYFLCGCGDQNRIAELESRIDTLEAQLESPQPTFQGDSIDNKSGSISTVARRLSITGRVFRAEYTAEGKISPMPEYVVVVTLKNVSHDTFTFDDAELTFTPAIGKNLKTVVALKRRNDTPEGPAGEHLPRELKPGETVEFESRTNGYTEDMLKDAGDLPIGFDIQLLYRGRGLEHFSTALPNLSLLPLEEKTVTGPSKNVGEPLTFVDLKTRIRPSGSRLTF